MIDTHIHLNDEAYEEDLDKVVKNAKKENVKNVIVIGCDNKGIKRLLNLLQKDDSFMFGAIGCHPMEVKFYTEEDLKWFEELINTNNKIVAIGEIGLDYHWYPEEKELQKLVFKKQIELAKKLDLPIIIHARDAYEDCYEILKNFKPIKGVMHSFASDLNMARKFIDIGMHIGFSGPITFKNGILQKQVASEIELQRILIETDGPYLTPVPFRGKRNLPEYVKYVAKEIALLKNVSIEEIIEQTSKNAENLFFRKREKNDF